MTADARQPLFGARQYARRRRLLVPDQRDKRRHYAYASCSDEEFAIVKRFARREGLSISDFVRRCINQWLLEEGDDVLLLTEYKRDDVSEV